MLFSYSAKNFRYLHSMECFISAPKIKHLIKKVTLNNKKTICLLLKSDKIQPFAAISTHTHDKKKTL